MPTHLTLWFSTLVARCCRRTMLQTCRAWYPSIINFRANTKYLLFTFLTSILNGLFGHTSVKLKLKVILGGLISKKNLGACNAVWAKAWGLYLGVKLARNMELSSVVFELDSQVIVNCVSLFQEIWQLLNSSGWEILVWFILSEKRTGQLIVLAKLGHDGN